MLSYLRKRKGSTLIKGMLIALALTFFGGFGLMGYCRFREGSKERDANMAASVDDAIVTRQQLLRAIQRANGGRNTPQTEAEALKQREETLNTLINQELVLKEAARMGIEVSDEEIKQNVTQIFQKDGAFNQQLYRAILTQNNMSESEFNDDMRRRLIISKMTDIVTSSAIVTDDDVYQAYLFEYQQAKLDLMEIDPEKITNVAQPTKSDISAKFKANPEGVTIPEKRKVRYACFNPLSMVSPGSISEKDMTDYYEKAKGFRFAIKPRRVKARKIFIKAPMGRASEAEINGIKERAEKIAEEVKAGATPFEELARKYSEDPETGAAGGDMGWVDVSKAGIPAGRMLQMLKPGEVSELAQGMDGFYIFKAEEVEEGQYKPLSQVRKDVIEGIRKMNGVKKANEAAQSIISQVRDGTPFLEAAKVATAEVKVSDYFLAKAEKLDNVPNSGNLVAASYKMWEINQVSDVVTTPEGACVLQLAEIVEEHTATFEEAIPILRDEILAEHRKDAAKKITEEILSRIQSGTPFDRAIGKNSAAKIIHTDFFARQKNSIPQVGYSPDMVSAAFSLPPHDPVAKKYFEANGKFYLMKLVSLKEAEEGGFDKVAPQIRAQLIMAKRRDIFESWVESLKRKANIVKRKEPQEEQETEQPPPEKQKPK